MAYKISCYAKFKEYFSDDSFSSFDEFNEKFQKFQDATFSLYRILDSNKVETENVRRKAKLSLCLKYSSVSFCCVHYGHEKPRGNGIRIKQTSLPQNCPSLIRLSTSARDQQLRIVHANLTHTHVLNAELYKSYRKNRLLSSKEENVADVAPLPSGSSHTSGDDEITIMGEKKTSGNTILKDKEKINNKNSAELIGPTLLALEQNKEAKFVADETTKQLQVVALATNAMKSLFRRFPDATFIDIKNKPNKHGFFLYRFLVEDELRHSRTVMYVFVAKKGSEVMTTVLNVFLELFPDATSTVKTVTLGMGFQQLQQVQGVFPMARILWCQFRVLRLCKKRIDRLPISYAKKRQLFMRMKEAAFSETESAFIVSTEEIRGVDTKFFDCFQEDWLPSVEFWARFERRNLPMVTNTTNILNQETLQRALSSSKNIVDVIQFLVEKNDLADHLPHGSKDQNLLAEIVRFLKPYDKLESALMRKNFGKIKCLQTGGEETAEHIEVVRENGITFIVKIDGDVADCNCTFNSRYSLPCRHIIFSCQNRLMNLFVLHDEAHCYVREDTPPPPVPQLVVLPPVMVVENRQDVLTMKDKFKTISEISGRMNKTLGRLGTVHFQKWMKVLQEVKTVIDTEFTDTSNCYGNVIAMEGEFTPV